MTNSTNRFDRRSDENLLQLWRGRDALNDEDIDPLRTELEQRGLSAEVAKLDNLVSGKDIYGDLPSAPWTCVGLTVPALWIREQWLRYKTREGVAVDGIIESTQRTRSGLGGAARAKLSYKYEFEGRQYSGQILRDFSSDSARADSLVYDNHAGDRISLLVCLNSPEISYFPSGIGLFDPVTFGLRSLFVFGIVLGVCWQVFLLILHTP